MTGRMPTMKPDRPVNLNLFKFKYPPMAIVSILHRISGFVLFLFVPLLLYVLHQSLISQESFLAIVQCLQSPVMKLLMWVLLASVIYHLLAGIRHMMMDLGFAESLEAGRITAITVLVLTALLIILAGVWLW